MVDRLRKRVGWRVVLLWATETVAPRLRIRDEESRILTSRGQAMTITLEISPKAEPSALLTGKAVLELLLLSCWRMPLCRLLRATWSHPIWSICAALASSEPSEARPRPMAAPGLRSRPHSVKLCDWTCACKTVKQPTLHYRVGCTVYMLSDHYPRQK